MSKLDAEVAPVDVKSLLGGSSPPEVVYAKQMEFLQKGYALWSPSPSLIDGVRDPHVRVGDLGYIDAGEWRFLFNIHIPAGASGQAKLLPKQFEVLKKAGVDVDDLPSSQQWSPTSSNSLNLNLSTGSGANLKGVQCSFTVASQASLAYVGPARREAVTGAYLHRYAQYTHRNCKHWEDYLADNSMELDVDRLVLVTACTLASSWITTVSYTSSSSVSIGVSVSFDANANISVSVGHQSSNSPGPMTNSGPVYRATPPPADSPPLDQCLFVKGFSPSTWDRLSAKVPDLKLPGQQTSRTVDFDRDAIELPKPSTAKIAALQYILQNSRATIALIHDDDLFPFVKEIHDGKDLEGILKERRPAIFTHASEDELIGSLQKLCDDDCNDHVAPIGRSAFNFCRVF